MNQFIQILEYDSSNDNKRLSKIKKVYGTAKRHAQSANS